VGEIGGDNMEEFNQVDQATPEQKKEIEKILKKARVNLLFIGLKLVVGLFLSNLISTTVGVLFLKDTDPEMLVGFQSVSFFVNFAFLFWYFDKLLRKNSDEVTAKVKEVLNRRVEESVDEG
jgi:hypothetical protein